jgi:hypothetical protein
MGMVEFAARMRRVDAMVLAAGGLSAEFELVLMSAL